MVINAGFSQYLDNEQSAPLQVIVDGTNSNTAMIALGYVNQVVARFQSDLASAAWPPDMTPAPVVVTVTRDERPRFNPGFDDCWFFVPDVVGTLTLIQV
ncbi:hypothetical protein ACEPT7_03600 [Burkholderia ubonensis]|uniref:hypothetical protein n=1 Tax=Burkholderia ubonensis TaxID=101571 RepID=UPI00358EECE0